MNILYSLAVVCFMILVILQGAFAPETLALDYDCKAAFENLKKKSLSDQAKVALVKLSMEHHCFSITQQGKDLSGYKYQIRLNSETIVSHFKNQLEGVNLN